MLWLMTILRRSALQLKGKGGKSKQQYTLLLLLRMRQHFVPRMFVDVCAGPEEAAPISTMSLHQTRQFIMYRMKPWCADADVWPRFRGDHSHYPERFTSKCRQAAHSPAISTNDTADILRYQFSQGTRSCFLRIYSIIHCLHQH